MLTATVCCPCIQDGRDFADVLSPKLPFVFDMAAKDPFYLHVIRHLVEGDTGEQCQLAGSSRPAAIGCHMSPATCHLQPANPPGQLDCLGSVPGCAQGRPSFCCHLLHPLTPSCCHLLLTYCCSCAVGRQQIHDRAAAPVHRL